MSFTTDYFEDNARRITRPGYGTLTAHYAAHALWVLRFKPEKEQDKWVFQELLTGPDPEDPKKYYDAIQRLYYVDWVNADGERYWLLLVKGAYYLMKVPPKYIMELLDFSELSRLDYAPKICQD